MRRITKISTKNLLGLFNHDIPLNMDERLTIIHGPNGVGKTILLNMLHNLFASSFEIFSTIPFQEFRVDFDDTSYVRLEKISADTDKQDGEGNLKIFFWESELAEEQIFEPTEWKKQQHIVKLHRIENGTQHALSLYVDDVEKQRAILDQPVDKVELLRSIINKRFLAKEMIIDRIDGFVFINTNGDTIDPINLSLGEQRALVMFYELLLHVEPETLVLIDEPEMSQHVAWQNEFLKDLQEIITIGKFDVLIATHSPDIIADEWELTYALAT